MIALLLLALFGDDFYPLKEGNCWTYRTDSGGEVVIKVVGKEKIGDVECFVVESESGKSKRKCWQAAGGDGVRTYQVASGERTRKLDKPILAWKLPPKKGDRWQAEGAVELVSVTETYTNEGEEEVAIGETKYKAWRVHLEMKSDGKPVGEGDAWYAKDVGLVKRKQKISFNDAVQEMTLELQKFEKK